MRVISQEMLQISILDMSLKINNLTQPWHPPGANELNKTCIMINNHRLRHFPESLDAHTGDVIVSIADAVISELNFPIGRSHHKIWNMEQRADQVSSLGACYLSLLPVDFTSLCFQGTFQPQGWVLHYHMKS